MNHIFIGGSPRSGTTLLQKILIRHENIVGGPELVYSTDIALLYDKMEKSIDNNSISMFVKKGDLKREFQNLFNNMFKNHVNERSLYISEKTPKNGLYMKELSNLFPLGKMIYIFRDGRDVVASFKKVRLRAKSKDEYLPDMGLFAAIKTWEKYVLKLNEYKLNIDQIYLVKYEDLVINSKSELKKLLNWLDLNHSNDIINIDNPAFNDPKKDAKINDIWYTKEMYNQPINKSKVYSWKSDLNLFEKFVCNLYLYENLRDLGYDISPSYKYFNYILKLFSLKRIKEKLKQSNFILMIYKFWLIKFKM